MSSGRPFAFDDFIFHILTGLLTVAPHFGHFANSNTYCSTELAPEHIKQCVGSGQVMMQSEANASAGEYISDTQRYDVVCTQMF